MSAVEFALLAPVLIAIPVPIADLGMGLYAQMELQNAAQAGAQYALLNIGKGPLVTTQVQAAVTGASTYLTVTANSAQSCGCPNGTTVVVGPCGTACASGKQPGTYITVTAQATYTPLVKYPVLGSSVALAAQSTVRIQ
ncbi:MAG: TadE/TadG family type IV pilus assembly protein [Alphaproteobacteria bacterium]|nr:TadE/TadG family type IV pilus assembly protein [Alphaproteobacteria bacterium]